MCSKSKNEPDTACALQMRYPCARMRNTPFAKRNLVYRIMAVKPKVYIARMTPGLKESNLWDVCDAQVWEEDRIMPYDALKEKVDDIEGLMVTTFDKVDAAMLDLAPKLRVISNYAVGVDNLDLPDLTQRGIAVGNTPGVVTEATADLTFALLLALSRRVVEADRFVKTKQWQTWSPYLMISNDVHEKTIGIIGMGRIGRAIAQRAYGFDMDILYHARTPKPDVEKKFGAKKADFASLLKQADIVVTIVPLTDETYHMIDQAAFQKMKPSAFLINTARGGVVDPKALHDALANKRIRGAALDVTEPEPIESDSPLLAMDNLIIAPHVGTGTWETRKKMTTIAVENLLRGLRGEPLLYYANPDVQKR